MAEDTVQIPIEVIDKATENLNKIKAALDAARKSTEDAGEEGGKLNSTFDSLATKVAQYVTAAAAIGTVVSVLKDSVAAAVESEEAQIRLESRVSRTGISWDANKSAIESAIESASRYALVSDEDVSAALSRLITVTGDVQKSTESLKLTMDLAADTGMDFESAAVAIGKALEGETAMLERQMPQLKALMNSLGDNATQADKAAVAIKYLTDNIGGTATQMGELTKASKTLSLEWDQMKEQIGGVIVPALADMLGGLNDLIATMKDATWKTWFDVISGNWAGVTESVKEHKTQVDAVTAAQTTLNTTLDLTGQKVVDVKNEVKASKTTWEDVLGAAINLAAELNAQIALTERFSGSAETIYTSTDESGNVTYSNVPSGSGQDEVFVTTAGSGMQELSDTDLVSEFQGPAFAAGGIVTEPTIALIGESGPEAIVPLTGKSSSGGATNISVNLSGPVMGSATQAKEYALLIDQELNKLTNRRQSINFGKQTLLYQS